MKHSVCIEVDDIPLEADKQVEFIKMLDILIEEYFGENKNVHFYDDERKFAEHIKLKMKRIDIFQRRDDSFLNEKDIYLILDGTIFESISDKKKKDIIENVLCSSVDMQRDENNDLKIKIISNKFMFTNIINCRDIVSGKIEFRYSDSFCGPAISVEKANELAFYVSPRTDIKFV